MEPRSKLAAAAEHEHEGHENLPGSLELDPKLVNELAIAETLEAIRAHFERPAPTQITEGLDYTRHAAGDVIGVAAGQAICTIKSPPPGIYLVEGIVCCMQGVAANMELRLGLLTVATPLVNVVVNPTPAGWPFLLRRVRIRGGEDLTINAIATDGAEYIAQMDATRVDRYGQP